MKSRKERETLAAEHQKNKKKIFKDEKEGEEREKVLKSQVKM